jgi:hypothetical protein
VLVRDVECHRKVSQPEGRTFRTEDKARLRERATPIMGPPRHHLPAIAALAHGREVVAAYVATLPDAAPTDASMEHLAGLGIEWGNGT